MTQSTNKNNGKAIILKSKQLSVEIRINSNTMTKERIRAKTDCHGVT